MKPPSQSNTSARILLAGAVLVALTLLVYVPAMRAGFIWDDNAFVTENPLIHASDGLYRFWLTTEPPDYFPLTSSMLWVEWRLWGTNAAGYHIVNVVLHAIGTLLVWRVLKKLSIPGAWLAALIFGIHPVNVESVAWITERKNTLPMVFYLATLLLYLHTENRQRTLWYVLALVAFLLALLSKTSVVMLPLVLLIIAWWQRGRIDRRDVLQTAPFFCLALALGSVTWWFQSHRAITEGVVRTDGFDGRLASAGWAVWFYLSKVVVPYPLSFVYPRWQIDSASVISYLPAAALLGCFVLFWRYRGSWGRPFLATMGYYVITLLPVLGFWDIYFMRYSLVADHWQYTSIIGAIALVVGLTAVLANRGGRSLRMPSTILAVVVVGALCLLTWHQTHIYTDLETLWTDTLSKNPSAWMAHNNLGLVFEDQGKYDTALEHYNASLILRPDLAQNYFNRGNAYNGKGERERAIQDYTQAISLDPEYTDAYHNRSMAYSAKGEYDRAIKDSTKALEVNPEYSKAYYSRAGSYYAKGEYDRATADYDRAIELNPEFATAYYSRGMTHNARGNHDRAIEDFTKAIELNPVRPQTYNARGVIYAGKGDFERALQDHTKAIALKSDFADALGNRAIDYYSLKQYGKAQADAEACLKLGGTVNPGFAKALAEVRQGAKGE